MLGLGVIISYLRFTCQKARLSSAKLTWALIKIGKVYLRV